jgi:hypothetical protein
MPLEGGLLAVLKLPEAERVGVVGKYEWQLVSSIMAGGLCWSMMVGLWWWAWGDASGVSIAWEMYAGC